MINNVMLRVLWLTANSQSDLKAENRIDKSIMEGEDREQEHYIQGDISLAALSLWPVTGKAMSNVKEMKKGEERVQDTVTLFFCSVD